MDLSIIIPAHNEQDNIIDLIEKIGHSIDISHELVIVNDHSIDRTVELVNAMSKRYHNIKLVENVFKRGLANTLKVGFNSATAEVVIPVMADLCDEPNTINRMYEKTQEGFDIVCGSRYMKGGRKIGGPRIKSFFSRFVGISLHLFTGIPTQDISNSFKLYDFVKNAFFHRFTQILKDTHRFFSSISV
jgi:glycosyltransferase involved in cell wall biosynthesis